MFDITRASIYQRSPGESWRLTSCLGDRDSFPDRCHFDESKNSLAAAAIRSNDIATCISALNGDTSALAIPEPVSLIAIPWSDAAEVREQPHRLLIIDRIPFARANWENFARVQALFLWLSTVAATAPRPVRDKDRELPKMLSPEQFEAHLKHVLDCSERFRLGYRLVLFERTVNGDTASQNAFVRSIRSSRRPGDALGGVVIGESESTGKPRYGIALVLPVDTDVAAEARIAKILKPVPNANAVIRYQTLTIAGQREDFLAQWRSIADTTSAPTSDPEPGEAPEEAGKSAATTATASDTVSPNPAQPV
jgi:hypothetical protein